MKILVPILIFLSILFFGHSCTVDNPCSLSQETREGLKEIDSILKDSTQREFYKRSMKENYDEPSVFDAEYETYRFVKTCHSYIEIIRIEKLFNSYITIVKKFDFYDEDLNNIYTLSISQENWNKILNKLSTDNFWISTLKYNPNDMERLIGCSWHIEGYKPIKDKCTSKNYHIIRGGYPVDSLYLEMYKLFDDLKRKN